MFRLRDRTYQASARLVMAIINVTPDSFYDGGQNIDPDVAVDACLRAQDSGADIVDIGGASTGAGKEVTAQVEIDRVVEVIARVRRRAPELIISLDSWRSEVAEAAIGAGVDILNDVRQGYDPNHPKVAGAHDLALICTHSGWVRPNERSFRAQFPDIVGDVLGRLGELADYATSVGVSPDRIIFDPGHDCGKNTYHSLEITRRLDELQRAKRPILVSMSNKTFLGEACGLGLTERLEASLAAVVVAALKGANIFRVHQVAETCRALKAVAAIMGEAPPRRAFRGIV